MRTRTIATLLFSLLGADPSTAQTRSPVLTSPDGRLAVTFEVRSWEGTPRVPVYALTYDGRTLIAPSRLGFQLAEGDAEAALADSTFRDHLQIETTSTAEHDEPWNPVLGERQAVRDHYRAWVVTLRSTRHEDVHLQIEWRAYDEGVAFRYVVPKNEESRSIHVQSEHTEFRFAGDHRAWAVYSAQGQYEATTVRGIRRGCERPLVLQLASGPFLAIGEAGLVDFARMKLAPLAGVDDALVTDLHGDATCSLPFRSPWRVLLIAPTAGELLERNDLFRNLNDPCAIEDTSWIRPGTVLREVTLTTQGGLACVDFAAEHGIDYVEFDAGWYGHEYDERSDATTVSVDPKRSKGPLDLHAVIHHATERGVGILLYVNRRALEKQLDAILPLYRSWGVRGVKYGFVQVGSQRWTTWLHDAVRKAAAHHLMVDVHDEYRPTGFSRTYPNLMTQEGIAGDETSPRTEQTLTLLFTRMLCGAADHTICYYDDRVARNASHAHQLAKAVCFFSPWQFVYWYDRPFGSPGVDQAKNVIGDEPELTFFGDLPTTWDDTRVLEGEIGAFATVARRKNATWYVGCLNGPEARTFRVSVSFLDEGTTYHASIYRDDPATKSRTHVSIERRSVTRGDLLEWNVAANGGLAMRIAPEGS
ncbi:MAG: glycoside hydrolase family 97 N-terminal domain-containing protein [Planctomycetes bacterium]|nr:glycoside hydrolase family 97 N-terminal domain-containing protein [Planctomycetota bacterium]